MKCFYYVLFSLVILNSHYFVNCKIKATEYKNYIVGVLSHLCNQQGWKSMPHVMVKKGILYEHFTCQAVVDDIGLRKNYQQLLYLIIFSLNCRYAEILYYFSETIKRVIYKCGFYLETANAKHFNNCTVLLYGAVTMSADMFGKLFDALQYMSQINLKNINVNMESPLTITERILPFYEFANYKTNRSPFELSVASNEDIFREFENIKGFFNDIGKTGDLHTLVNNHCSSSDVNRNRVPLYLQRPHERGEALNEFDVIGSLMMNFYSHTIKNDYQDIGFAELLDPENSTFWHPTDKDEEYLTILNSIMNKKGWNNLNHITLIQSNQLITVGDFLSLVNAKVNNYWIKRKYLSKFMRCRYTEILQSFNEKLGSLLSLCVDEQESNNTTSFIHCTIRLYDTINRSSHMFDRLLSALITIRKMTNHNAARNKQLLIEKLIDDISKFIKNLSKKYPSESIFIDLNDTSNRAVAIKYLNEILYVHSNLLVDYLFAMESYNSRDCIIEKKASELTDTLELAIAKNNLSPIDQMELVCVKLNSFYENVVLNDCEYLGFH
ncbi:uncharacterized protein LOC126898600 [Daktulosphaira vitifoliae]|uniref:uncharacterized protein LOC126898600 n=1 Tax=Daktulosphaira vitifoliae TaxID=58002 RepID=UPI0021A9EC6B|nr:uncharacterized protein LOC126898600 [Daktulosphaira vitifoliae]